VARTFVSAEPGTENREPTADNCYPNLVKLPYMS
jgi:hypothetical protein